MSNAGSIVLNFDKFDKVYSDFKSGVIDVKFIRWTKKDGKYNLVMSSLK